MPIEIAKKPVAFLSSSKLSIDELLDIGSKLSKGEAFVLLVKNDKSLLDRVLPAYINAYIRYREKNMRSSTLRMEVLLFIAGTMKISSAIKSCGAEDNGAFIVIAESKKTFSKFRDKSYIKILKEYPLRLDERIAGDVAVTALRED